MPRPVRRNTYTRGRLARTRQQMYFNAPEPSVIIEHGVTNDPGQVDLLFTTHNRREFTVASFGALLDNTNWELVRRLFIVDDQSIDGTLQHMCEVLPLSPIKATLISGKMGGPAISMNIAIVRGEAPVIAKIDNDVIVCPGWLDEMLRILHSNDHIDALGMEPGFGEHVQPIGVPRGLKRAKWIGGVGLIRRRVFDNGRRVQLDHRWFGWTLYQRKWVRAAWITPALPVFLLDHLDFEPWRSYSARYIKNEWQRAWPTRYPPEWAGYWEWYFNQKSDSALRSSAATN